MNILTNPFSFDSIVTGENFCNREVEIEELLGDIRSCHNIIMFSQRRYGKTSLIKKVLNLAKNEGLLTIYTDIYHILNEDDLVKSYARALASTMDSPVDKMLQTLKTVFSFLRPKISLDDEGNPEFTFGVEKGKEPSEDIQEVFESVYKYITKNKMKAAIVFDEFQQIGQLHTVHRIESIIRSCIQEHQNISYIFMGSKKHLIFDLFSNPTRPLYGIGKMFPLGKITPEHLSTFVYKRFNSSGKKISKEASLRVVDICESHPYYTQYVSHTLWEITPPDLNISKADIYKAMDLTINRISPRYEGVWELLPVRQRQSLIALSNMQSNEKIFSGGVIQRYGLVSAASFRKALHSLLEKGLVDMDNMTFSIIDVFFKQWIQKNFSI